MHFATYYNLNTALEWAVKYTYKQDKEKFKEIFNAKVTATENLM